MLLIFLLFLTSTFSLTLNSPDSTATINDDFIKFKEFIKLYDKDYDITETFLRFEIFRKNLKLTDGKFNQFTDLNQEEFLSKFANLQQPFSSIELKNKFDLFITKSDIDSLDLSDLPVSFDWRDHNVVTSVKNQGQCGSCWAFSATENIESQYAIKTKKLEDLSVQQLLDCDTLDHACAGGFPYRAFEYIKQAGGIETAHEYSYKATKQDCKASKEKFITTVVSSIGIEEDEEVIKAALVKYGPLSVALNATLLQMYFGGIVEARPPFTCDPKILNHAVLLVGYGIQSSSGKKYWIVKNSWGKLWGEFGYFKILRGAGECGINRQVYTAEIKIIN